VQHLELKSSVAEDSSSDMQCYITGQVVPIVSKDYIPFFFYTYIYRLKQFLTCVSLNMKALQFIQTSATTCPMTMSHPIRCKSTILVVAFDDTREELKGISES